MTHIDEVLTCDPELLNTILRDELAVVDIYTQAMTTFDDEFVIADLQKMRDEHSRVIRELRDRVVVIGIVPTEQTGVVNSGARTATEQAKTTSPIATLNALRQAEEDRIRAYESTLENADIHPGCDAVIRTALLPACRKHVEELNQILAGNRN